MKTQTRDMSAYRKFHLQNLIEKIFALPQMPQLDRFISLEFSKNKKYGSQDRKWYSEKLFSIFRRLYLILYQSKYKSTSQEVFTKEIHDEATFWSAVKTIPFEKLYALSENRHSNESLLTCSIPLWLEPYLKRRFTTESELNSFLDIQNQRPLLWIRLNHSDKYNEVIEDLKVNDFVVNNSSNPNTLSISGTKSVYLLDSFQKGFFEIQDYASQKIGYALNAKPGDYIWDACAGGGGKTMQIASILNNKGVVYATDIREYKLEEVKRRAKKAQFFNVRTMVWNGKELPAFPKEVQNKKGFNCVLIDAPCSASGTWRRHPDAKYKTDSKSINELTDLQFSLLSAASPATKIGGKLVYGTCSVFVEENEDIINKFLGQNTNFKLVRMSMLGAPLENADSMFVAVLEKIA